MRQALRGGLSVVVAGVLAWAGCGGSTDIGGGNDGGAGAAAWAVCTGPGQCVVLTTGCCGPCGPPTLADVAGVNEGKQSEFRSDTCTDPHPTCPKCATGTEPNLVALCDQSSCSAIDLRQSDLSACATDADCMLRDPACCESCAAEAWQLVAIATAQASKYQQAICKPDQSCPACAPIYPAGYIAACVSSGHCEVRQSATLCPDQQPTPGTSCGDTARACEYGEDLRPGCRTHATCSGGAWQIAVSGCPPLPGPGQQGCPADATASGTCASDGLVCDMGGGTVCGCGACLAGPCSVDPRWGCASSPATPGCPTIAPALGSACSVETTACVYGLCGTSVGAGRRCTNGAWVDEPVACPV